ncbi:MAG: hypothetical protein A3G24_21075 [Betaproteobacteria bacterium RIFCSPLOWO2_12_FULL_62_13]|nr:MAG: hypothetical protein A3G24_21075 [Betaproteobacteria bacterium RIFCSPLOWO2_12_FULL_62_13]
MCHLVLALPLVALPVLWLLPFNAAVPLYGMVVALSAAVYILAMKAMRMPVSTGAEALLHASGTVRSAEGREATVWIQSELWSAESASETLVEGDQVEVVAMDGLTLKVRRLGTHGPHSSPPVR